MAKDRLKIMVLAGGPDRERPVSLSSGTEVSAALRQAGHEVRQRDIASDDLSCLDEFLDWGGDVIFPALHGTWGEGGRLQHILDQRGLPYVGSSAPAAELCMDKHRTKLALAEQHLPTPPHQLLAAGEPISLTPPLVLKPPREGSSIDLLICRNQADVSAGLAELQTRHPRLLVERFIAGREITIGVIEGPGPSEALPPIQIVPATGFYDYAAKYEREDTRYLFEIDLPSSLLSTMKDMSMRTHSILGCRHLSRVDFIVDEADRPWILEINTIPGFTRHSLLPMAAGQAGMSLPHLYDRLARLALGGGEGKREKR